MSEQKKSDEEEQRSGLAVAFNVGWELVAITGLSFWLGYWLDGRFRTSPWGVLVLTVAGICGALYRLVKKFTPPADGGAGRG